MLYAIQKNLIQNYTILIQLLELYMVPLLGTVFVNRLDKRSSTFFKDESFKGRR